MNEEQLDGLRLNQSYDKINLLELLDFFNEFYRKKAENRDSKIFSKDNFLREFLCGFELSKKNTSTKPISETSIRMAYDKIMSKNHRSSQYVEAFRWLDEKEQDDDDGIAFCREKLKKNIMVGDREKGIYERLFQSKFSSENLDLLFLELIQKCDMPHFSKSKLNHFDILYKGKKYAELLYEIMLHAFSNAWRNLPFMYTERLYQESLTLRVTNPLKDQFLKLAADLGHREAALEYGMRNYEPDLEEGITYFLKACPQEAAYWTIAFQLEKKWQKIDDALLKKIQKDENIKKAIEYAPNMKENNTFYIALVPVSTSKEKNERLSLAIKIYLYLCTKQHFTKAFNSIGKLLILGEIRVESEKETVDGSYNVDNYPESRKQAFRFLNYAISIGNPHAMVNMARYWLDRRTSLKDEIREEAENNREKAENWMRMMADMREIVSCEYYANLLAEKGKGKEALKYYEYAIDQNSKSALLPAARISETLEDYEKARKYNALHKFYLAQNKS